MRERVRIKQATKQGWIYCDVGGVFKGGYETNNTTRGRVINDGHTCPTITTLQNLYRIEKYDE